MIRHLIDPLDFSVEEIDGLRRELRELKRQLAAQKAGRRDGETADAGRRED